MRRAVSQTGVALLSALITVSIVAALAASAFWLRWQRVEVEVAQHGRTQTSWLLSGAFAWSRLILSEDGKANANEPVDHVGEPWAVQLQASKISTFLSQDKQLRQGDADAYISGRITDQQAKLNLNNLVNQGRLNAPFYLVLRRLFSRVNMAPDALDRVAGAMQSMSDITAATRPIAPRDSRQLTWLGLSIAEVNKLSGFVTWLPTPTPVNVNTAPEEVLGALMPELSLGEVRGLIRERSRNHWASIEQFKSAVGPAASRIEPAFVAVKTDYFLVSGSIRFEDTVQTEEALMHRQGAWVRMLWRRHAMVSP